MIALAIMSLKPTNSEAARSVYIEAHPLSNIASPFPGRKVRNLKIRLGPKPERKPRPETFGSEPIDQQRTGCSLSRGFRGRWGWEERRYKLDPGGRELLK